MRVVVNLLVVLILILIHLYKCDLVVFHCLLVVDNVSRADEERCLVLSQNIATLDVQYQRSDVRLRTQRISTNKYLCM